MAFWMDFLHFKHQKKPPLTLNPMDDLGQRSRDMNPGKPTQFVPNQTNPVDTGFPTTKVPTGPGQDAQLESQGKITIPGRKENGDMTNCPFVNFVWKVHANPSYLLSWVVQSTQSVLSNISLSFQDVYAHLKAWNGTVTDLVERVGMMWKSLLIGALTILGAVELGPLFMVIGEWFQLFLRLITGVFSLTGKLLNDVLYLMEMAWNDITRLFG